MHFVLCKIFGLNRLTTPFHALFPPPPLYCFLTKRIKVGNHEPQEGSSNAEMSRRTKCTFERCTFVLDFIRKLEKAAAERSSGKFRRCWKMILRFSGSAKCYPCQGLGTFRQGKRLLENWPHLRERCWIFSSETATAFLSSSDYNWQWAHLIIPQKGSIHMWPAT